MNLNQYDRQAFVKAVMDDVPTIDYKEQGRVKAVAAVVTLLPKEVQVIYKKYPEYLDSANVYTPNGLDNLYMPRKHNEPWCIRDHAPEVWAELVEVGNKAVEQTDKHNQLRAKLRATIDGCRTLKQALERLPEFAKYLPKERGVGSGFTNLPIANLVAELNAAGWPK